MTDSRSQPVSDALLRPVVLASLVVLVANDHWGKARWPGLVTGKLSDVAGLVFFPVVLAVLAHGACRVSGMGGRVDSVALLRGAALVTVVGFTAVKASAPVAALYSDALGWMQWPVRALAAALAGATVPDPVPILVRADPWDLLALPAVLLAIRVPRRQGRCHGRSSQSRPRCTAPMARMSWPRNAEGAPLWMTRGPATN